MGNPLTFPDSKARHYHGLGLAFGAGLLWSLGGLLIKSVDWNPLAIAGARSAIASLIASIEPILNPLWVFLALGEKPGPWALIGGAIVLIAVTGRSLLKTAYP